MSKLTSVAVGMPSMGKVQTWTVTSMIDIIGSLKIPKYFSFPVHTYAHEARRICVEEALAMKVSHLFFLDSDMMVKGDVIQRLAAHNKPVIGVLYNERRMPPMSTVKFRENGVTVPREAKDIPNHLFKCYAVGTGCMLIDIKVFEKIEQPWFFYSFFADGRMDYGEDVWFCEQVHKAGMDVWCDPTIDVRHIGDFAY